MSKNPRLIKKKWKKVKSIEDVPDFISMYQKYIRQSSTKKLIASIKDSKQEIIVARICGGGGSFLEFFLSLEERELTRRLNENE